MISNSRQNMEPGINSRIEPLLNSAAVFILATVFLFWDASRAVYLLLSLTALGYLIKYKPRLPRDHQFYSWPILGFVGATFLSLLYHDLPDSGVNILLSRYFLLLLAIPLVGLFYASYDSNRNIWVKFVLGSVTMGLLALVDILILNEKRAGGGHNPAVFGFIALAMTAVVIASYHRFENVKYGMLYYLSGVLMGFCAMFLSGTRSSWIAGIVVIIIATIFYLGRYSLSKRILVSIALVCCIAVAGISIPLVQKRIDRMVTMVTPYIKGEEQTEFTSLRYRVEAWKAAWNMGMTNKGFGIGPGNFKKSLKAYARENPHLAQLKILNHAHNQFLQTFAMSGLVGLVPLLILIACHLWIFTKYLGNGYSFEVRSLALAGFMLLVAYLIKSIPGVPFYGKQYLMMYAFMSASIWGCLLGALAKSERATEEGKKQDGKTVSI